MPICAPSHKIVRDTDKKLMRTSTGELLKNVVCEGTLKVTVSGFAGDCADMNGEYIVPLENPATCSFDSAAAGGSEPGTWGGYMLVYWYTFARPYQWRMRISPAGGGEQARSYNAAAGKNPNHPCPIGVWALVGKSIFPFSCTGQTGAATSEWN